MADGVAMMYPPGKKEPHPEAEIPSHSRHQHINVIADDDFEECGALCLPHSTWRTAY